MISNEYGFNFIEIPLSGSELFLEAFKESNRECKLTDERLDTCIEYHTMSIVKSPYLRASCIFRNGSQLRKEHNLNKRDSLSQDTFHPQYNYIKDEEDIEIFKYENLLDDWSPLNSYLANIGLNSVRYFSEQLIKNWQGDYKEDGTIELVEYIFEDDFENLGYSKL
jgi:hypothetical protein